MNAFLIYFFLFNPRVSLEGSSLQFIANAPAIRIASGSTNGDSPFFANPRCGSRSRALSPVSRDPEGHALRSPWRTLKNAFECMHARMHHGRRTAPSSPLSEVSESVNRPRRRWRRRWWRRSGFGLVRRWYLTR